MNGRERLTTDKIKIFARESLTIMSITKDNLRKLYNEVFDRLQEYEVAEEEGNIIVPPCKVGDTVYVVREDIQKIYECIVTAIIQRHTFQYAELFIEEEDRETIICLGYWNKRVFPTKEAAEEALRGGVQE